MECQFSNPLTWENMPPASSTDFWAYSHLACTSTENVLIQNATTGAEFYLSKTLNYGDAIIIWFLTIFAFVFIFKIAWNFFWKK